MENKIIKEKKKNKDKLKLLLNRIIISLLIFISLCSSLFFSIQYSLKRKESIEREIKVLNDDNNVILAQIKDIINKSLTARNYISKWEQDFSANQKKLGGIDIVETRKIFEDLVIKNNIINLTMDFSPVIVTQDAFQRESITTYTTMISLSFSTITDINVYSFLDDLKKELPGFIVIQEISLKRTKKIDDEFLKTLSTMNIMPAVDGNMKIRLYGLKQN